MGVVFIKIVMILFLAVPILCALTGADGPVSIICDLVPSQPAFEGIMALSVENMGVVAKNICILLIHCVGWSLLYILSSGRRQKHA